MLVHNFGFGIDVFQSIQSILCIAPSFCLTFAELFRSKFCLLNKDLLYK